VGIKTAPHFKRYRPARLDLHDQDQDQPLHTKMNPTSCLFGLWFV
jgi:hypothetical protein